MASVGPSAHATSVAHNTIAETRLERAAASEFEKSSEVEATDSYVVLRPAMLLAVLLGAALLLCAVGIATGFWAAVLMKVTRRNGECDSSERAERAALGLHVRSMSVQRGADIKELPERGYDCALQRPYSSSKLVRLQLRVCAESAHLAPLSGRECVIHCTSVSQRLHTGVRPVQLAFSAKSTNFYASLQGEPVHRILIHGSEVSLFDMVEGIVESRPLKSAPDSWQDFLHIHRTELRKDQRPVTSTSDSSCLEFQECALFVGALVTAVGELHRSPDGTLLLRGWQSEGESSLGSCRESWRTSWEAAEPGETSPAAPRPCIGFSSALFSKVLLSDNPELLEPEEIHPDSLPLKLRNCCGGER